MKPGKVVELVAMFEGFKSAPYKDAGGVWTIGFGSTFIRGVPVSGDHPHINRIDAMDDLTMRLFHLEGKLRNRITQYLPNKKPPAHQVDAMISLADNIGLDAFEKSTLFESMIAGAEVWNIYGSWLAWSHVKGKLTVGLWQRRMAEAYLYAWGWKEAGKAFAGIGNLPD